MGRQLWMLTILSALCYSVQGSACGSDYFNCTGSTNSTGGTNSTCIPRRFVCDGKPDCGDSSDENDCPSLISRDVSSGSGDEDDDCPEGKYLCNRSRSRDCIPESWLCDGENDCGSWEDEATSICGEPRNCTSSQYRCAKGHCIADSWECDGDNDCGDHSDEAHCDSTCAPGEVVCPDQGHASCILASWICDGEEDCVSGWDEKNNCSTTHKPCPESQFQCNNGECIPTRWECDGEEDCLNGEDEKQQKCSTTTAPVSCHGKFRCNTTSHCIHMDRVCDGVSHCPDGSDEDEESCNATPIPCLHSCDGNCLTSKQLCDNQYDCTDRSDEPIICHQNECSIRNGGCSDICEDKIIGHECLCPAGYAINGNTTCQDVDECKIYGSCSQECFNTQGSYLCKCKPGYDISRTNSCKAFGDPPVLLFSHELSIRAVNLLNNNKSTLFDHLGGVYSLDFDYHSNMVYWYENKNLAILRAHIGNQSTSEKIVSGVEYSDGIAYDWIHHKIYWTNAKTDVIEVADRNGKNRRVIVNATVNGTIEEPRAIAVDPFRRHIYWTDWGNVAKIEKATIHGKNRTAIITTDVWWPNGLTIDFTLNRIYWIDAKLKRIETCDMHGHHRVLVRKLSFHSHPFAISVFEDHIYWSDWHTSTVEVANKFTGKNRKQIVQLESTKPLGIKVQHQALQQPGVECFKPVQPHYNITNIHKNAYIVGRNVTVECEAGYLLVGNATITCSNHGTWKPHLPVCVPIRPNCTIPKLPHHNITGARMMYFEGENFTVKCKDGFKLIGDESELTCSNAGNWTPRVPHCTKILPRCPKPQGDQYNMTVITRDDYKLGHNLTITCNQGYKPLGFVDIMCSNDSTWVPGLPSCVLVPSCPKPQKDQYNMTVITRDDYNSGYNLTISCNQGYQPVGITQVMCSNESTWIPDLPDCVLGTTVSTARCPRPQGDQYNMTVITRDDYNTGYNLTISCNQGYQLVGITQVKCSNESTWIPALPDCVLGRTGATGASRSNDNSGASVGIGISAVVVIILAIAVIVVGILLFFRLRKQRTKGTDGFKYNVDDQEVTLANAEQPIGTSLPEE